MPNTLEVFKLAARKRYKVSQRRQFVKFLTNFFLDRNLFIDAFQEWFKIDEKRVLVIKEIIGMLHNASLLVDDIEDNSVLRRGKSAAHLVYGKLT